MDIKTLILNFVDNSNLMYDYCVKMRKNFIDVVKAIQTEKNIPHIKFTDEDGYVSFFNEVTGDTEQIYGVKVVDDELYLYTDDYPYKDIDTNPSGWFEFSNYGDFSFDEMLSSLISKFNL